MLDRKFVVENLDLVEENCRNRGVPVDVRQMVALDEDRKAKQTEVERLNREANEVSGRIGKAGDEAEREKLKEEGRRLREQKSAVQAQVDEVVDQIDQIHRRIPNMSHPKAPVGKDESDNRALRNGATAVPSFDFEPKDHVALGESLDLFDFQAGGKVTGHGFYYLKNEAALLEIGLQQYVMQLLVNEGFSPVITPDLARNEILGGIGFIPRGPETQIYSIENSDLSLIATAEITLGGIYAGETLDAAQLPIKLCGVSHCFRTEAGAHGKESRGLYRVHQFTKVEMFAFTPPEQSEATLDEFCALECRIFDELGIPYQVVDTATGDLGGPAYRKFDLEAWMPGRGDGGEYGEVTSTSNCTDYQARRLKIRYKTKGQKGTHFVHTLNGTAIAVSRTLIAILENYQQADGTVVVPEVLRPILGKERIGTAK